MASIIIKQALLGVFLINTFANGAAVEESGLRFKDGYTDNSLYLTPTKDDSGITTYTIDQQIFISGNLTDAQKIS